MRRLLPQAARAVADGSLGVIGYGAHGLTRVDWRSWPAEQAAAVEAFLHAWWQDAVSKPDPPYGIDDIFDTCATIARTVTPFLDGWGRGTVADAHLVHCAEVWLYDLLSDLSRSPGGTTAARTPASQTCAAGWLAGPGAARLRAPGEPDLAIRAELLALPYDERWAHPYWASASATN
ncbi:hypothetical protein [Streptomyces sp. TLI_185]|uniref:hypothetical protein n=1 Tax=Streptomyces sp. TLI_185 TaxID=2485151 RepID=UPI0021A3CC34|nr:hypothetical protein [Streptomyces sp. TLI_185]